MIAAFFRELVAALGAIWTDKGARSTMLGATLFFSAFFPQPYLNEVVRDLPVAVIDQDGSTLSRELIRRIDAADAVAVVRYAPDMPSARSLFLKREVHGIVVIPPRFERDLLAGRAAPIASFSDGGYFLLNSSMSSALSNAARSLGAEVQIGRLAASGVDMAEAMAIVEPLRVTTIPLFNPAGGYASFVLPAVFVLILQQTLLMGIGNLKAGRRPGGALSTLADAIVYVGLYSLWAGVVLVWLPWIYRLPRIGDVAVMYAVVVPFLAAVTAMGIAVARLIPTKEGVIFFLVVLGMPLFFLSGVSWPAEAMPGLLHAIAFVIPSTTAVPALVRVNQMGADIRSVETTIAVQLGLCLAYSLLAVLVERAKGRPAV
ncbi:ABC-2 type transporter [uncultured Pleomorphomonas sp.]|uniref:ABC-2 type transporter n=1 Tax=uncultured Pleomorphomonas sp. TaxID=442121 RepID=A0A212LDV8_9HYPH|nr:ABC transporter permease [uncultured Pleomorphomonas sp.]SCM75764.1 ABC-2 type transporter [uncultured Pleomorphomonas sp.]